MTVRPDAVGATPDLVALLAERDDELASLRRRYETLSTGMSTGLVVQDADGQIVEANAAACRLLGLSLEQMQGRVSADPRWGTIDEHGDPVPGERHPISVARATASPVSEVTMGVRRPDGTRIWVDVSADVVVEDGAVVLAYSTFTDITTRHELAASVRAQEQQLRSIVDDSPLGIATAAVVDGHRLLSVNRAFCRQLGRAGDDLLTGTHLTDLLALETREQAADLLAAVSTGRQASGVEEWELERTDGARVWIRVVVSRVLDSTGAEHRVLLQAEDVTEQRGIRERMERMAHHDALTGLANRSLVTEMITVARARAARSGQVLAVMFLDLDHFKLVNDTLGHDVGDQLLCVLAERLVSVARTEDTPARLGGDEFMVLLQDLGTDEETARASASTVADRIIDQLGEPVVLGGEVLRPGVSIGIALGTGAEDQRELLRRADLAMYRAKADGRHRFRVYESAMREAAVRRAGLERDLQRAIAHHELCVHLQPVVDVASGRVTGAEALLRWQHPTRGLLTPADFLEVAEDSGLIVPIDTWVLGEACRQLTLVRARGVDVPVVNVNVSGLQLAQRDVLALVQDALAEHGLEPSSLAIELTERTLIDAFGSALRQLDALHRLGVRLGLDDFGTGHSSLRNVKDLPVSFLKVDQTFVKDILTDTPSRAVVAGVTRLGTEMGLDIVAEGVEDAETLEAVRALGCGQAQGWLFGHPVVPSDFGTPVPA